MTMVKEGIQTRRRKQKSNSGNPIAKSKQMKTSIKSGSTDTNHNHGLIPKAEEYASRSGNYPYGELYGPQVHLVHHPFEQHQRFSSQQQLEMAANGIDPELCAREILTSPIHNNDEQHLNIIKTVNSNQP